MGALKHTPLFDFHVNNGARMVPFGGWEMPVQYTGILAEHIAVREAVGLFDVSHMGEASVTGPDAQRFLNYLVPNNVGRLKPGKALYTPVCHPSGGVVDDVIIYCMAEADYLVVLNASNIEKDIAWLQENTEGFDCQVDNVSAEWAQLALQGPNWFAVLQELGFAETVRDLKRFNSQKVVLKETHIPSGNAQSILLSRTGYTGSDGVEIYCPAGLVDGIAQALLDAGKKHGLLLCGLGARDSLRLEAGLPLYGHEITDDISPLEAGLGWTVKFKKDCDFIGRAALEAQRDGGIPRKVVQFTLEGKRIARPGTQVFVGDQVVGEVVSGGHSATKQCPIGSALVESEVDVDELFVDVRGHKIAMQVAVK